MSIHINCPNCHIASSLALSKLSAQVPISAPPNSRERPSPTIDLSDIPIDGAMRRVLPLDLRHRDRAQNHMARHRCGYHVPGHLFNSCYTGHLNQPIPHGQPQQPFWEKFGIPTRDKDRAHYAIHRAVKYAYEKGYKDAQKSRDRYHSFRKVLDETDKKESNELKKRLGRETIGKLTDADIADLTASQIRELLEEAKGSIQKHQSGHKGKRDRIRRDKSRTRSHHAPSPHRNQESRRRTFEDIRKRVRGDSEDLSSSESDDEEEYAYR